MLSWLHKLHDWQDLSGAIIGGLLGVSGALIVARSVSKREHRTAARMLMQDLLNFTGMVYGLTYKRTLTLAAVGAEKLAQDLSYYRHQLSPLFESQMAVMIAGNRVLAGLLIGFKACYASIERHMQRIERAQLTPSSPPAVRDRDALPGTLQQADEYATAALYLLELEEMGVLQRVRGRLRRRWHPDKQDRDAEALIKRLTTVPESAG